jgi:hypothetical protein
LTYRSLLDERKKSIRILILGAYSLDEAFKTEDSDLCIETLKRLKVHLTNKGFLQTRLVEDWKEENGVPQSSKKIFFRDKSFYYIDKWADILLFIFLQKGNNNGVTREWGHMIESSKQKCKCSIILWHEKINLGTVIGGDIEGEMIRDFTFKDENQLQESAYAGCFNILFSLVRSELERK